MSVRKTKFNKKIYRGLIIFIFSILLTEPIFAGNEKCFSCHGQEDFSIKRDNQKIILYINEKTYNSSVHGKFSCTSCHEDEANVPHENPLYGKELAKDASKECAICHQEAENLYSGSVHSNFSTDNSGAVCSDCHGSHDIVNIIKPESPVSHFNISQTCLKCHSGKIKESYEENFHGKAVNLGSQKSATCVDCHNSHNILSSTDPNSSVSKENRPEICANCHGNPHSNFAEGSFHWTFQPIGDSKPMYWTLKFFTWLTIIVITLLIIHIELDLFRKLREALNKRGSRK